MPLMSRRDAIALSEPTPTSKARLTAAVDAPANDARTAIRHKFDAAFNEAIEQMDLSTYDEIHHRYGGDPDRELIDIKEGLHPLQRGGRDIDAYAKYEAKLAAIRAKLGR
jgi:hypothetical protein